MEQHRPTSGYLGMKLFFTLLSVCAASLTLVGCANESVPYTEQTAAIDPAITPANVSDNAPGSPPAPRTEPAMTDQPATNHTDSDTPQTPSTPEKVVRTDEEWRAILSTEEYRILRQSGTEYAGTGRYLDHGSEVKGSYHCVGCGNYLYGAEHKFHSHCGWPSFNQAIAPGAITEHRDTSHGMIRTEMRCARCEGHLGHIFNDGFDQPTGMRHCVNGVALIFVPEGEDVTDVIKAHRAKYAGQ